MVRVIALVTLVGVAGVRAVSADSSSAQLGVSVTVVRSCAIDARPGENASPALRLTCTSGARANLRLSESQKPAATVSSDGLQIVTIDF